jgi:hypothetical protein
MIERTGASRRGVQGRAFVAYDARVVFAVDLETGVLEGAEIYTDLDDHRDTALTVFSVRADVRARLEDTARAVVERSPRPPLLRWSIARWSPVEE